MTVDEINQRLADALATLHGKGYARARVSFSIADGEMWTAGRYTIGASKDSYHSDNLFQYGRIKCSYPTAEEAMATLEMVVAGAEHKWTKDDLDATLGIAPAPAPAAVSRAAE